MNLSISTAPHIRGKDSVQSIMLDVLIALLPTTIAGVYYFGKNALLLVVICVATAVLSEFLWSKLANRPNSVKDLSAAVTGLILALNLPAGAPWWMGVIGSAVAIIIVKQLFGGIGKNFANPAITARIVMTVSFASAMTDFSILGAPDALSSATPLTSDAGPI